MKSKQISVTEAVSMIKDGMTVMIGGFMAVGSPISIIDKMVESGVKNLTIICNDTAFPDKGIGKLVANKQVKKIITSHIGTNPSTIEQFNNKEIDIEFNPQGTLVERIRSAGAGLGGFLTPTGLGTVVQNGKQVINVDGRDYLLEKPLKADVALLGASISDTYGNLFYKGSSQNFNTAMATAADLVIAEAEEIVEAGKIAPENVATQSIFVHYIVKRTV
ncbi:MAG: CoA transferase subunit A [Tenuifilaceae bacterium]|jgi:acetate CoA/acetoacetate CoA-transferase alpha subunit|nr:CoA transferase subunit A [Bacteroidales bacterium]MDI9515436.1 CoA transferase subunit A [Bacteroidota bacterium]NLH57615.1 CoA transferase subunit A [Rikenellaceae bacterium]OQC62377.1 MAG: Acetate CoA-transferase subunit alpha [Bacteroidetes bacterium ADurb.Bin008]HNV82418.1 CoA transferase subunit A [Tenuifilaceae bacterium]